MDKDRRSELLAGELFEMIAFGWTTEDARGNEEAFFDRIGDYAEGFSKEEVWEVWENAIDAYYDADFGDLTNINANEVYSAWTEDGDFEEHYY